MDYEGQQAFTLTSPLMHDVGEHIIRECPTGRVLRESPSVYRAISIAVHVENGSTDPMHLSHWSREAIGVVGSERARLRALEDENRKLDRDRGHGRRVLRASR